jgi:Glycosyltransferase family 87
MTYALMWAGFAGYLGVLAAAPRLGRRLVWAAIGVLVAGFAAAPVLLSHDVYSYVDYARLGVVHGLDPYVFRPSAAPADPAFAHVTWTGARSAYGPLFTLATYPLAWLPVGTAVALLKAVAAASVLGLAALVARLAPARGLDPTRAAAFVALNPLVLVHVVGGAHNDALAMLPATAGVAAVLAAREAAGGAAFVTALMIKAPAALAAPFALLDRWRATPDEEPPTGRFPDLWASNRPADPGRSSTGRFRETWTLNRPVGGLATPALGGGTRLRFLLGAVLALTAIGLAAYLAFGWHWLDALTLAGRHQNKASHLSVPSTFARLTGLDPAAVRAAALTLYAALFVYLLAWTWRGGDWLRAAAWASLGLLLATAWLLPWYLIWALPLAALSRDRPLQLLLLALTAFQLGARISL